jgi:hypothetical protein
MLCLRQKLREYNTCFIPFCKETCRRGSGRLFTPVAASRNIRFPEEGNLGFLNQWLKAVNQGNHTLKGLDRNVWKDGTHLLAIKPNPLNETFTRLLRRPLVEYYHKIRGVKFRPPTHVENNLYKYEKIVLRAAVLLGLLSHRCCRL